jgi:hypothetical protein
MIQKPIKIKVMKKIMMMLVLLTLTAGFAFGGERINKAALSAFRSEFAGATDVTWTASRDYYEVRFTFNDQKLFAFYNNEGEFMAVTHFISSIQLPHHLKKSLKRSLGSYWISDLFEIGNDDTTSYYITLENANRKIVLRSTDGSNWSFYAKTDKE